MQGRSQIALKKSDKKKKLESKFQTHSNISGSINIGPRKNDLMAIKNKQKLPVQDNEDDKSSKVVKKKRILNKLTKRKKTINEESQQT